MIAAEHMINLNDGKNLTALVIALRCARLLEYRLAQLTFGFKSSYLSSLDSDMA
jgi:hypothetical protein